LPTTWPSRSSLDIARSRITIDLAAAGANARRLGERLGGGELWAVVKADGYGHGAAAVAGAALEAGATGLAVATLAEAVALREVHRAARILILSPLAPGEEAGVGWRGSTSRCMSRSTRAWGGGASPRPRRSTWGGGSPGTRRGRAWRA
jgi:D-serine deaminase-like pyridoxal phosphate-dependent protein